MRRQTMRVLGVAAGVLVIVLVSYRSFAPPTPPLYTVAQVKAGIAHDPQHWVGRQIRIRAIDTGAIVTSISSIPPGTPIHGLVDPRDDPYGSHNGLYVWAKALPIVFCLPPDTRNLNPFEASFMRMAGLLQSRQILDLSHPKIYMARLVVRKPCRVEQTPTPCVVADLGAISGTIVY